MTGIVTNAGALIPNQADGAEAVQYPKRHSTKCKWLKPSDTTAERATFINPFITSFSR